MMPELPSEDSSKAIIKTLMSTTRDEPYFKTLSEVSILKHAPTRSVFRAELNQTPVVIKQFHHRQAANTVRTMVQELSLLSQHMTAPNYKAVTPIAAFPELGIAVLGFISGTSVSEILETTPSPVRSDLLSDCAHWLETYIGDRCELQSFTPQHWLDLLAKTPVPSLTAAQSYLLDAVQNSLISQAPKLESHPVRMGAVHGDFIPDNLIKCRDTLWGIDIQGLTWGSVTHDCARFLASLHTTLCQPEQALKAGVFLGDHKALFSTGEHHTINEQAIFRFFVGYELYIKIIHMRRNPIGFARVEALLMSYFSDFE